MSALSSSSGGYTANGDLASSINKNKIDPTKEIEAKEWMAAITKKPIPEGSSFHESMKDGTYLCGLLNSIAPGSVKKIEVSKMPFKQMENVSNFIKGCRSYGVLEHDLFETVDLFDGKDIGNVISCIFSLGRTCQIKNFDGPVLGPKSATKNVRTFSDSQTSGYTPTMMSVGSSKVMERTVLSSAGTITSGAASGSGDLTPTMMSVGSSKVMERTVLSSAGTITSGAASGTGDKGASKMSVGSSKIMERNVLTSAGTITSGAASGSGDKRATLMSQGSSRIMARSQPTVAMGITYGADAGTKASLTAPMLPAKSSATPAAGNTGEAPMARGAGYGLDAELAAKQASKYSYEMEEEAQAWLMSLTKEKFTKNFGESLKNGTILCKALNVIEPGAIPKIETSTLPYKQMENISNFLKGCRAYGVKEYELFETVDLFDMKDLGVVVSCIHALYRTANGKGSSSANNGAKLSLNGSMAKLLAKDSARELLTKFRGFTATVVYSYVAAEKGELSINEGKIVNVIDMISDPIGWWLGEDGEGNLGIFPFNYVEVIQKDE